MQRDNATCISHLRSRPTASTYFCRRPVNVADPIPQNSTNPLRLSAVTMREMYVSVTP
jgi:hypothetical protein